MIQDVSDWREEIINLEVNMAKLFLRWLFGFALACGIGWHGWNFFTTEEGSAEGATLGGSTHDREATLGAATASPKEQVKKNHNTNELTQKLEELNQALQRVEAGIRGLRKDLRAS